jgi:hypothetical protein
MMRPPPARPHEATPKRDDDENDPLREQKILDKKRKRMSMRREYEEQVQRDLASSDSSDSHSDLVLRPGLAVALDEVMSFSKKARIIVQSAPPYVSSSIWSRRLMQSDAGKLTMCCLLLFLAHSWWFMLMRHILG